MKQYPVPTILEACLNMIEDRLNMYQYNLTQREYDSPFKNTGNSFKNEAFEVRAYDWGWDSSIDKKQPYNFKWQDVEICWYKYIGRGMFMNRDVNLNEIEEMLTECLKSLNK
jgi:hypothetical protein